MGWVDGWMATRAAGGRARGGMDGVDGTKWHLLRSCPLTPSMSRTGFAVCIHRRAEAMVEFGVIRPVSRSLLCLAASLSRSTLRPLSIGPAGIRGGRGVGTKTGVGSLVQVDLRPGLGRGQGGVGAWERKREERQLQVSSTLPRTRYMLPCTAGSLQCTTPYIHGDAGLLWARMWAMWVLR